MNPISTPYFIAVFYNIDILNRVRKNMQKIIYADVLIFLNAVVTFVLLLSVAELSSVRAKPGRIATGSLVGGVYSLIILAPPINFFALLITKIFMCISIVLLTFHVKSYKKTLKCLSIFVLMNFLYAGVIYFFSTLTGAAYLQYNNGYGYIHISTPALILITAAVFAVLKILHAKFYSQRAKNLIYKLLIRYNNSEVCVNALYDSGNSICDAYTGRPVVIVSEEQISELLNQDDFLALTHGKNSAELLSKSKIKIRYLPVSTIGGKEILPAFTADRVIIENDGVYKEIEMPSIAVTSSGLGRKDYRALINAAVLE